MVVPLPFPAPSVFFLTPDICFRKGWQSILGKARTKRPPPENGDPRRFVVEQKRLTPVYADPKGGAWWGGGCGRGLGGRPKSTVKLDSNQL